MHIESRRILLRKTMYKVWNGFEKTIQLNENATKFMCLTQAKDKATSVKQKKKHKGQLKMMEDEQNLKKILSIVPWQKRPKRYI